MKLENMIKKKYLTHRRCRRIWMLECNKVGIFKNITWDLNFLRKKKKTCDISRFKNKLSGIEIFIYLLLLLFFLGSHCQ